MQHRFSGADRVYTDIISIIEGQNDTPLVDIGTTATNSIHENERLHLAQKIAGLHYFGRNELTRTKHRGVIHKSQRETEFRQLFHLPAYNVQNFSIRMMVTL